MKRGLYILLAILFGFFGIAMAQSGKKVSIPKLNAGPSGIPDSLLYAVDSTTVDSSRIRVFKVTDKLGDRYVAPMDTMWQNMALSTLVEGRGLAVSYLANFGSPAQSRLFFEREEENDFIFINAYNYYLTTPQNALFYDVKEPYTQLNYMRAGGQLNREEIFSGVLTTNFGKKLNIGADFDYTYVRGQYTSNADKHLYYRMFGSYNTDRYEANAYFRNYNYVRRESGGLTNDRYVSHPDEFTDGRRRLDRRSFPTRFTDTWNRNRGKQIFLTHRYNLGFYRELTKKEKEDAERKKEKKREREAFRQQEEHHEYDGHDHGENIEPVDIFSSQKEKQEQEDEINAVFVPVSSIIHTVEYEDNQRRFLSSYAYMDTCYDNRFGLADSSLNDFTKAWSLKNTIALSLREGFQDWAKFGLTAFIHLDKRRFTLPSDSVMATQRYNEFSSYLGAELSKRIGKVFTYKARGEFCLAGSDLGEFRFNGELQTKFKLLNKNASIRAYGYLKNLTPAFYMRHHHSRYFWWDNDLKNIQKLFVGGEIDVEQTKTKLSAGVESIQHFAYFGNNGVPEQYGNNLQTVSVRIKQDFKYKVFGWENEVAYQVSSEKSVLPLPEIAAYTNIYLQFVYAKVLHIQLGADAHYHTSYYAPYYEPATQQFQNQDGIKIGSYPIINAYANFFLKQARFFISGYNVGSLFISPTEYFSAPHYPLNPMHIKMGISVYFNN